MSPETQGGGARAFVRSLNILLKFARLYEFGHAKTTAQFDTTWRELRQALEDSGGGGGLLGGSGAQIFLGGGAVGPAAGAACCWELRGTRFCWTACRWARRREKEASRNC